MSHPTDPSVAYETTITANTEAAWTLLINFGTWDKWCPLFKSMRIINGKKIGDVGSIRKYTTITEVSFEEILQKVDHDTYTFQYDYISVHPTQPGLTSIVNKVTLVPIFDESKKNTHTKISWSAWVETHDIPEQARNVFLATKRQGFQQITETLFVHILAEEIVGKGMEFFNDKIMALTRAVLIKHGETWEYDSYPDWMGFMPKMVKGLPASEALAPQRLTDMLARFLEIVYLQVGELIAEQSSPQQETEGFSYEKGNLAIVEYGKIQPPGLKAVTQHLIENWSDDAEFCRQLIQGVNPLHIKMVTDFSEVPDVLADLTITEANGEKKSAKQLFNEKRLFILDYTELAKFDLIAPQYFAAPIMLVYREILDKDTSRLNILGIQLHPSHKEIYTPDMKQQNRYKLAKMFVANADNQFHEFRYHLGISHMGMEPVAVAVNNRLPKGHPLRALLTPHLDGTIGITFFARQTLVAEKEAFTDKTFAIGTKQGVRLVSDGWRKYDFFRSSFPEQLKARGFDEAGTDGLKDYFYRDDGFRLWNAIGEYTKDVVDRFYKDDAAIVDDSDLQRWADEMSAKDAAAIPGFPATIKTKELLRHILQILIWNGSAQHSVVNFPQYPYSSYVPNRPNGLYRPMPELPEDESDISDEYLKQALAPEFQMLFQLTLSWILTLPSDASLTDLRALKDIYPEGDTKFQASLAKLSTDIKARNKALEAAGKAPYIYLLPENVACSVNI